MGTKGCINYNLTLAHRQLGYLKMDRPTDQEVEETVYFGKGGNPILLEKVRASWGHVHKKGKVFFGQKGCLAFDAYAQ